VPSGGPVAGAAGAAVRVGGGNTVVAGHAEAGWPGQGIGDGAEIFTLVGWRNPGIGGK